MLELSQHETTLRRLSFFYVAALGLIGLVLSGGEFWVQTQQSHRSANSRLLRELEAYRSHGIQVVRAARAAFAEANADDRRVRIAELRADRDAFASAHEALRSQKSFEGLSAWTVSSLSPLFDRAEPAYREIVRSVNEMLAAESAAGGSGLSATAGRPARRIQESYVDLAAELSGAIAAIQEIDDAQAEQIKLVQLGRLLFTLALIIFAGLLIFKPAIAQTREAFRQAERTHLELAAARDEALDNSRFKSAFLANMSHEIRTPMNGIIGTIDLMKRTQLAGQQREYIDTVETSAETLLQTIDQVLDLSKLEAGTLLLENQDFDPRKLVADVAGSLAPAARAKGLEFGSDVEASVPAELVGDPVRLAQILANLVENAIKWTEAGEVRLSVSCGSKTESDAEVQFSVRDTGVGLTRRQQERLFQPFIQGDASTTRRIGGAGLGLAISKQLIDRMKGSIAVESTRGKGSTFRVGFRFELPEPSSPGLKRSNGGHRALVADADPAGIQVLRLQFASLGIRCDFAKSAAEALGQIRQQTERGEPYDFAVFDLGLPDMDGLELAREFRNRHASEATRVILMAPAETDPGRFADDPALDGWIAKPVKQKQLSSLVKLLLGGEKGFAMTEKPREAPADEPPRTMPSAHILLVEDNPTNQRVTQLQLGEFGLESDIASNGKEAIERLRAFHYDLILMDCQMPIMDGYQATRVIRRTEGPAHIPIIAMTAHAMKGDRERCLEAGMDDYIAKPVREETLRSALERWLRPGATSASAAAAIVEFEPLSPTLDMEVFEKIRKLARNQGGPSELAKLIQEFLQHTDLELVALGRCVDRGDLAGARERAHSVCGSVGFYGAAQMTHLCQEIQKELRNGNLGAARPILEAMRDEAINLREAMEREVSPRDS